jgi:hypothetical protein
MFYIRGASFWQQDQAWQQRVQRNQQDLDVTAALISKISSALTNQSAGLASIANNQALTRVNAQIKAAKAAAATQPLSGSSSTSSTSVNKTA